MLVKVVDVTNHTNGAKLTLCMQFNREAANAGKCVGAFVLVNEFQVAPGSQGQAFTFLVGGVFFVVEATFTVGVDVSTESSEIAIPIQPIGAELAGQRLVILPHIIFLVVGMGDRVFRT